MTWMLEAVLRSSRPRGAVGIPGRVARWRAGPVRALLVLLPLLAPVACTADADPPAAASRSLNVKLGGVPGGGTAVTMDGVRLEIGTDVTLTLPGSLSVKMTAGDGRAVIDTHDGPELLIDGQVLQIVDGRLLLGGEQVATVAPGDVVHVTSEGLVVERATGP